MAKSLLTKLYVELQSRKAMCFLCVLWLCVQAYLFRSYGVKLVPDSLHRYLPLAQTLLEGKGNTLDYNTRYIGYIYFIAFFLKAGLPTITIILTQVAISGLAAVYLYKLTLLLYPDRAAAFIVTLSFILWHDVQYFNYYIITESLFTSFLILSYYTLFKSTNKINFLIAVFILLFTTLLRPNGFLVFFGACVHYIVYFWPKINLGKVAVVVLTLSTTIATYVFLNFWLHKSYNIILEYQKGEIIYAAPKFAVVASAPLQIPADAAAPFDKILFFIFHNPLFFLRLFSLKVIYFLGYIKPYHSLLHIVATIFIVYPMYVFSIIAIKTNSIKEKKYIFGAVVFIAQIILIGLTVEDWDNRFIIPFLPYIFLFGGIGLTQTFHEHVVKTQKLPNQIDRE